jgi:alanine-alpha-ketoisovalerate/valine-pyruvate aminotransferase
MMLESTHASLRPDLNILYPDGEHQTDIVILTMTLHGEIEKGYNINYGDGLIYMNVGSHAGFAFNDNFFFGAFSDGFKTKVKYMAPLDADGQ